MEWEEDRKHNEEVRHPRVIETGDRSPQLTVDAWHGSSGYSCLQLHDYVAWKKPQRKPEVIQLPLLGLDGDHTDTDADLG
jgi:putative transposase